MAEGPGWMAGLWPASGRLGRAEGDQRAVIRPVAF